MKYPKIQKTEIFSMKKILAAILCALFALVPLSACGESGEGKTTIRLNEVTHSVFYAPMYAAEALGYFEEENIEIELTNGGGADAVVAAGLSEEERGRLTALLEEMTRRAAALLEERQDGKTE